jgi:hypothetical protein
MKKRNDLLIYGVEYDLYRDGEHIGSAVWTDDENVGEAFLQEQDNGSFLVFTNIDEWEIKNK